jgi:hypothetical protein
MTTYAERKAKRTSPRETMLVDFLRAKTPHEKREVIKTFNPYYFVFGDTLNPQKENHDDLQISL